MNRDYVIRSGMSGVDQRIDPIFLSDTSLADAVNIVVENGMLKTRYGVRYHKIKDIKGNVLGVHPYQPSKGYSCSCYEDNCSDSVILSTSSGIHIVDIDSMVVNETHDLGLNAKMPNHWVETFENLWAVSDGVATVLYDGDKVRFSNGLNKGDSSEIPNNATAMCYAHGSLLTNTGRNHIVWGDVIHNQNQTEPIDIVKTSLHNRASTFKNLSPPSSIGHIVAMEKIEANLTIHGHNAVVAHGKNGGTYFIDLDKPTRRTEYDAKGNIIKRGAKFENYTKVGVSDSSALNPRALVSVKGDQFYRDTLGVQSLMYKIGEANSIGAVQNPLSEKVRDYIDKDCPTLFDIASVGVSKKLKRLFASTGLVPRGARGYVSHNLSTLDESGSGSVWEGLHTLPLGQVQHFVEIRVGHRDLFYAVVVDDESNIYLVEFDEKLDHDILPDGNRSDIEWQIVSKKVNSGIKGQNKSYNGLAIQYRNITTNLNTMIHTRTNHAQQWKEAKKKCVKFCGQNMDSRDAQNSLPVSHKKARWIQFLIRGVGNMQLEEMNTFWEADPTAEFSKDETSECCNGFDSHDSFSYNQKYKAPC